MANLLDKLRSGMLAPVKFLLPKNPWLRLLVFALPILLVLALFGPALDVVLKVLDLVARVLEPLLQTTVGRILLLLVVGSVAGLLVFWLLRSRVAELRGEAVLGRHLRATARLVSHDRKVSRDGFVKVARYRGPAPDRYPHVVADASLKLARLALERDRVDEALGWLTRVVEKGLPKELLRSLTQLRCRALVRQGKVLPETLAELLTSAVEQFPDDAELLAELRDWCLARGDRAGALEAQERLVRALRGREAEGERQRLVEMLRERGAELLAARDDAGVRTVAKRLAKLDPTGGSGAILGGDLLAGQGDVRGAARAYGSARSPVALERMAALLDRHPGALEAREILEACPLQGSLLLVARELARQGESQRAARAASMAAEALGPSRTVCAMLAEVLQLLGRDDQARMLRVEAVRKLLAN